MEIENVWFDGVSKELLKAHCSTPAAQIGDHKTLMTKTPLPSIKSISKKPTVKTEENGYEFCESEKSKVVTSKKAKLINGNGASSHFDDSIKPNTKITDEVALDCEMVECYHHKSVLARVSIVNLFGHPILDRYVAPPSKVTDYRTKYSGIRRRDLENAPSFENVQKEVKDIIRGRIVVGHAIHNDFSVLKIQHPPELTRDTSVFYRYLFQGRNPSLKKLSESLLGVKIQKGEHDSVQDAQATMKVYVLARDKWNQRLAIDHHKQASVATRKKKEKEKKKPKKKKTKTFYVMT